MGAEQERLSDLLYKFIEKQDTYIKPVDGSFDTFRYFVKQFGEWKPVNSGVVTIEREIVAPDMSAIDNFMEV